MKLIRWIFSNIILIIFVLALTYAYVYWDNLTGEDTPAGKVLAYLSTEFDEIREYIDTKNGEAAKDTGEAATEVTASEAASEAPPAAAAARTSVPQAQPMPPQQMTRNQPPPREQMMQAQRRPMAAMPMRSQQNSPQGMPPQGMPPQGMQQQGMQPPPMPPRRAMPEPPPRPDFPVASTSTDETKAGSESTERALWISARKEFQKGNTDLAIRNYKEVIAKSDNNYDAYGELGNVYHSMGNYKEAVQSYYQAAVIMANTGQQRRAASLLPMLSRTDPAKAEELKKILSKSTEKQE